MKDYSSGTEIHPRETDRPRGSGAVAVIECFEEIPCNPCEDACPRNAITVGKPITNVPRLDASKCTGCGACISACPGLAIFVVDEGRDTGKAQVSMPYEFYPFPRVGDEVTVMDRRGRTVGTGMVMDVKNPKRYDHTAVITVQVERELANVVRAIKIAGTEG